MKKNVLIVSSDGRHRRALKRLLRMADFRVLVAESRKAVQPYLGEDAALLAAAIIDETKGEDLSALAQAFAACPAPVCSVRIGLRPVRPVVRRLHATAAAEDAPVPDLDELIALVMRAIAKTDAWRMLVALTTPDDTPMGSAASPAFRCLAIARQGKLGKREMSLLSAIVLGQGSKTVAGRLGVNESEIDATVASILTKTGMQSVAQLRERVDPSGEDLAVETWPAPEKKSQARPEARSVGKRREA